MAMAKDKSTSLTSLSQTIDERMNSILRILLFLQLLLLCGQAGILLAAAAFHQTCSSTTIRSPASQQHQQRLRRLQKRPPTLLLLTTTTLDDNNSQRMVMKRATNTAATTSTRLYQQYSWTERYDAGKNTNYGSGGDDGQEEEAEGTAAAAFPQLVKGIYRIKTPEQHAALLKANPDKLVVMKFTASYCHACAALNPRFDTVVIDPQYNTMPILWADFAASPHTKDYFRRLGVLSLPTVHFYDGPNGLVENFPCGKTKIPVLKMKLQLFQLKRVDQNTGKLKVEDVDSLLSSSTTYNSQYQEAIPRVTREVRIGDELITQEHLDYLRNDLPFLTDLTDSEFATLLQQAKLQTFNEGDIIIRQGKPGRTFFVIKSGRCEMLIRSRFNDPISTPPSYLGAVVNELTKFDYFGERALSTGEPYAATVRVLEKTRCFAFDADIIPESSILSKQRRASRELTDQLTQRYHLPADYTPRVFATKKDDTILELLIRFKQIRQAAKCFEYVTLTEPIFGDKSGSARRSLLVSKLSKSQQEEFKQVFNLVDVYGRGRISLLEMRKFMASAREQKTDQELLAMIGMATPSVADPKNYGRLEITLDEFMGVMAEAEFYSLFTETFQALDTENIGYVSAGDLDQVLGGVRDLFSDDRSKSLIDVEDKDVQIDYEQFSKMLIGAAL